MENNTKDHPVGCQCPVCLGGRYCWWGGYHHHHPLLKLIVVLIVLALVFWLGVKIGELKSLYGGYGWGGYGYPGMYRMMGGYGPGTPYGYGPGMMGGWYWPNTTSTQK